MASLSVHAYDIFSYQYSAKVMSVAANIGDTNHIIKQK